MRATRVYLDITAQEDININIYNSVKWRQFLVYFELDKASFTSNWIKHYNTDIVASRPFHWIRFNCAYRLCVLRNVMSTTRCCPCYGFVLAVRMACPVYPERFKDVYAQYLQENWVTY